MQLADLNADHFMVNALVFSMLDDKGKAAVIVRHAELVAQKSSEVHNDGMVCQLSLVEPRNFGFSVPEFPASLLEILNG